MTLSPEFQAALKQLLVLHEDKRNFPYVDTEGKITIGIGYNLTDRGLPDSWINQQYNEDVAYFYNRLTEDYRWFTALSDARKMVLIDMCFMGYKTFQGFKRMLSACERGDFATAAKEMLDSKWAKQVKGRAGMLADMMENNRLYKDGVLQWAS